MDIPLCLWLLSFAIIAVMGKAKWWQAKDTQGMWRKISPALPVALGPGGAEARSCTQGLGSSGLKTP